MEVDATTSAGAQMADSEKKRGRPSTFNIYDNIKERRFEIQVRTKVLKLHKKFHYNRIAKYEARAQAEAFRAEVLARLRTNTQKS
jgi:hypothetical protein